MGSSLVKFANHVDGNGRGKLYWGRVEQDGLPFRGPGVPFFTEEEYEDRVVRVADPKNGRFRTWVAAENKAYLDVLDMVLNGWAVILYQDTWKVRVKVGGVFQQRHVHYVVWAEYFLEDGSRSPVGYGQPVEFGHGSTIGTSHPHQGQGKAGK